METKEVFERTEKKYLLDQDQYEKLMQKLDGRLLRYEFSDSIVHSLYLDNPSFQSARESMQAESYKEKIRLRAYGEDPFAATVFFELKKKYDGIVYKRRISLSRSQMLEYLKSRKMPNDSQVMKEIDYALKRLKDPVPSLLVSYDRKAYLVKGEKDLRITFDQNMRYCRADFFHESQSEQTPLLKGMIILEIKIADAMPLWLSSLLAGMKLYPASSSKYETAYRDMRQKEKEKCLHLS